MSTWLLLYDVLEDVEFSLVEVCFLCTLHNLVGLLPARPPSPNR